MPHINSRSSLLNVSEPQLDAATAVLDLANSLCYRLNVVLLFLNQYAHAAGTATCRKIRSLHHDKAWGQCTTPDGTKKSYSGFPHFRKSGIPESGFPEIRNSENPDFRNSGFP